ncbi:hypothetical protein OB2597_01247 [Pseudooceanicola batsensis HTCC2597]|uniref:Uncharacterized protein n=2 Tax=Pseudooceanicola batsensis TaxID=314255 RepID=A3U2U2_PSEBH|nr:hypothetical protein OB2597_01247 [Pseudooceanicola batsensis HTCC2597]
MLMPLRYEILPEIGLVYIRYWGLATLQETAEAFLAYAQDPLFRPGQNHLIDLSRIDDYERNFPDLIKLQAAKADFIMTEGHRSLTVYYAPTRIGYAMALSIIRSWEGLNGVVPILTQDEGEALALLGVKETQFADLPMKDA